jgi:hypothetical protein
MPLHDPSAVHPTVEMRDDVIVAIVRTPDGREAVEVLPADYERMPLVTRFQFLSSVFADLVDEVAA